MDIITYALSKKIAAHAVSGIQSMSVNGQTLTINTKDSGVLTMTFPTPKDGVSVADIDVNANNQIVFTMSDGTEFISGKIPTVKGDAGFSPIITENADNTDKIYKLDITTADSTFTTPNLKGGAGGSGEENKIDSISVNGVNIVPDENKNVDITVPKVTNDLTDELKSSYDDAVTAKHTHDNKTVLDDITAEKVEAWDKAEKNIQSDWNETDDTADGFIKNKPTIPDITGLATETYVDNKVADYTKTVDLADVATSGSYNDLADKPIIPSLDGYARTSEIPSKVSELENDSNYLSSIPEEYVTETELSAKGYLTEHQDLSAYAKTSDIPTTLPANGGNADTVNNHTVKRDVPENAVFTDTVLEINDADVSKTTVWSSDKVASEIASAIAGGEVDLSAYQKKNDTGLCTMAQDIVGAINEVKEAVDSKVNYDDTVVKADIAELKTKAHTHANTEVLNSITSENIQSWNNKSEFDGNYNTLTNKPTLPVKLSDLTNDSGYITNIADDLLNYYKKSDTYSKEEIAELIGNINKLTSEIVESLPTENISTSTIYLIKDGDTNNYKQYMYISGAWAQLSDTNIDLSGYAKLTDLDTKVDKVAGKTLSTNDFTNVLKSKLDGIAEGANKTVVDAELSTTSTNPVQNAIVTTKINTLANKDGSDATGTWGIDISGTAAKATADKNGNDITTTYTKQADFEKIVGNVDIINYTDQIIKNTDVVAYMFSTNIRKVGHIVTFVINITVKAVSSYYVQLGTLPEGVRPPASLSYNTLTNKGDACYIYIDSDGGFGIRKISTTAEFTANDGVRFCANYITEE